jgi:hypothetical protein
LEIVEAWDCVESCPVRLLDEQSGELHGHGSKRHSGSPNGIFDWGTADRPQTGGESGGASRFFYTAKASSAERNAGLEGFEDAPRIDIKNVVRQCRVCGSRAKPAGPLAGRSWPSCGHEDWTWEDALIERTKGANRNSHPTVKPIALMRWLVRLVTPPGGTVLDPFVGSGTTGIAAALEGFNFVGIEREEEYVRIAEARIRWWGEHPEGLELSKGLEADRKRRLVAESGQLGFLD